MFISGTEPSEVSNRFSQLENPTNLTATKGIGNITLSWTSPGVPDAVDNIYLTNYFTKGYTEWAENYLNKMDNTLKEIYPKIKENGYVVLIVRDFRDIKGN